MDDFRQLEHSLTDLCAADATLGLSIALVREARLVYAQGFGVRDNHPVTATTPFEAGSLTKPVFAYAVLKLVEQGHLNLDTPLTTYLPDPFAPDEPYLPLITARHALSHTTGFPNWRAATGLRAAFDPGTRISYSGEGYFYLQTVVERLVGQPLHAYLAQAIFEPLGMANSQMMIEDWSDYRPTTPPGLRTYAAASLRTTAPDYARFLLAMLRQGAGDAHYLGAASLDQMLAPQIPVGEQVGLWWGVGWGLQASINDTLDFWQWGGWRDATRSFTLGSRARQSGMVVLTNSLRGLAICQSIIDLVWDAPSPAFDWLLPPDRWRADGIRQ